MSTPVVFNGVNYSVPAFGDVGYAQGPGNLSSYLIAIASGTLQPTGGLFSLTADLDFGPNFGLESIYYKSASADIAQSGVLRLANTDTIAWRDFANAGDLPLAVNASDQLTFDGVVISTAAAGGTVNTGVAGRLTLYPAAGNTVDDIYIQNSQNIDILIAAQAARSVALEYTIPNPGNAVAAATFALLELAQTFTAAQTFATTVTISATTNQLILGTTNTVTLTSPAPAASRTYTIPDVLGASDFLMTAGAQTITGAKTFQDQKLLLQETGGTDVVTINVAALAASRAYTVPDVLGSADFVMTAGAQTLGGVKTFTSSPLVSPTGAGDAYIGFNINGGANWTAGADDSASDAFVISNSATPGTDNAISISTAEVVTLPVQGIIRGTSTNDNAAAGYIGEYVVSTVTNVAAAATTTYKEVTAITLTAGDWDISATINLSTAATTTVTAGGQNQVCIGTTTASETGTTYGMDRFIWNWQNSFTPGNNNPYTLSIARKRVSITSTTTYYLNASVQYGVSTASWYATLSARRMR